MKKLKDNKGITLITLAITIVIMLILIISINASMTTTIELKKYNQIKEDIIALSEEVKLYYLKNEKLPVYEEKTLNSLPIPANALQYDVNPNDEGQYYYIDASKLSNLDLNCGEGNKIKNLNINDIYVVNEKSMTIYYLEGAVLNGKRHYTIVDDFEGGSFAEDYYSKVELPIISVITLESSGENKNVAGLNDTVTLKMLSNYTLTKTPTVTINDKTVTATWNGNIGTATYTFPKMITVEELQREGKRIEISISDYEADGRIGETINNINFGKEVIFYAKSKSSTIDGNTWSATNPVIPKGYIAINQGEAEWDAEGGPKSDKGLVITDSVIEENEELKSNGNEWVWVPVPTPSDLYVTVTEPISITGGSGKTVVNDVSTSKHTKSEIISGKTRGLPNTTSYREPDIVVGNNDASYDAIKVNWEVAGFSSIKDMAEKMIKDYDEMTKSIEKFKGFYIGRYELSNVGEKKNQPSLTNTNWYNLYAKCKELNASNKVTTRMIWGCQWDVTCKWLIDSGEKTSDEVLTNSSNWGNYADSTIPANTGNYVRGSKQNTGSNEAWIANNIYDLAGNCDEWTQEAYDTNYRVMRSRYLHCQWL